TTSVTGGTLKFSAAGTTPVGNSIIVNDTGTLTFGRYDTWGNAGTVSSAAITVNSGGTLASGGFFNTLWNLSLNDGTLLANGGVNATFPAFQLGGTLEVTGTSLFEVGAGANNMVNIGAQGNAALTISTPAEADSLTINTTLQNFGEQAGTLIKSGSGTLTLTAASTYTGATTVNGGTLNLTGSLGASVNPLTVNDTATLTGNGTLSRPVTIASGGTLIPGGTAIDTLAVYSTLTLGGKLSCQIDKTGGTLTQDLLDTDSVVYGGTLEVVASGEALTLGDSFKLFNTTGSYSGAFASASLPTLSSGLNWDLSGLVTNGVITVVNTASQPIFNPSTGGYVGALPVTISSSPGAIIHYTMDGSDPTTSGTVVSGASPLVANIPTDTETLTLTAYASQAGFLDSATASAGYSTISTPNWNVDDNGDWSETTKWKFGVIARGAGVTADFNTMAQSADTTINLDSSRTIGSLVVGNTAAYDWTLAGSVGSALTLEATGIPAINVVNQIATISVPLAGTQGFTKSGDGTLRLTSGASNYTGDVTVAAGLLQANGSTGGPAPTAGSLGDPGVARTITVDSGATLSFGANDTLGNHGSPMNVALVIRGTVTNGGNWYNALGPLTLDGGTLHASGGVNPTFPAFALKGPVTALAGAVSIISGIGANAIYQIGGNLVTGVTFEVQDTAMLDVPAILQDGRALNYAAQPSFLTKDGTGTLTLGGSNTYTGNTTVNAGILALSDDAQLRFVIGAAEGINNQLAGAGTVVLDGDFAIDTAAAAALTSGSWTLEDVPALAGAYGATFTVVNPDGSPWTDAGSDQWTKNAGNGSLWTFDETTGMLTLGASGNYESWAAENGVTGGPNGDSDNDGIPNLVEYALNLNPAGSDGSAGSFTGGLLSFTKRDVAVTNGDVAYAIQESDDLGLTDSWEAVTPTTDNDATISYALPAGSPKKFARLVVTQAL
ncbi:MAG: autotransporter-associated beta strand repeat-containing protein, partial [Akkermansiaceae bacterium]|nr:autotransporter-associated beta strand repeat-containing protein [Akkermansiaceae bacterium]